MPQRETKSVKICNLCELILVRLNRTITAEMIPTIIVIMIIRLDFK